MKKTVIILLFCTITPSIFAQASSHQYDQVNLIPPYQMQNYDNEIAYIYRHVLPSSLRNPQARLIRVSAYFLGRPYYLGPTGEGITGEFDQDPPYRTDVFDCMTYVETILALLQANNLSQFQDMNKKIRYQNGNVTYLKRNHFTSVDWNPNNQKNGYIQDITAKLQLPYRVARNKINKPAWYTHKKINDLTLFSQPTSQQLKQKMQNFHSLANQVSVTPSQINYIPLAALFDQHNDQLLPRSTSFAKIPANVIVEIVNARNRSNKVGTDVVVDHMGFLIQEKGTLVFREASSLYGKIIDIPLINYLSYYWHFNEPNNDLGINIERLTTIPVT